MIQENDWSVLPLPLQWDDEEQEKVAGTLLTPFCACVFQSYKMKTFFVVFSIVLVFAGLLVGLFCSYAFVVGMGHSQLDWIGDLKANRDSLIGILLGTAAVSLGTTLLFFTCFRKRSDKKAIQ